MPTYDEGADAVFSEPGRPLVVEKPTVEELKAEITRLRAEMRAAIDEIAHLRDGRARLRLEKALGHV